jgi:hypothetical protein
MRWIKLDLICICFKKLTHHCFKSSSFIWSSWIDSLNFLYFFYSIRFTSAQLASSPPFPLFGVASHPVDIATHIAPCHVSFPLNQDDIADSVSSFDNASSSRLSSRTETLNPYYHNMTLFLYRPTLILHCYKKDHLNIDHSPHHSITSLFYLLPSKSTTSSKLHPSLSFPFIIISRPSSLHIMAPTLIN